MRFWIVPVLAVGIASMSVANARPASVALCSEFSEEAFANPDSVLWPGYFWLWNAPLDPEVIKAQLRDMADHGARSVCMLPMPHDFRPENTNNSLDPDYLTPEFFQRVRLAVEEASSLGMKWWLYDEGGWPSGSALGKVTEGHPEFRQQRLTMEKVDAKESFTVPDEAFALIVEKPERKILHSGEQWAPSGADDSATLYRVNRGGYADLLNPEATRRFIELTHEGYRKAVGNFFGSTILFTFTDEPGAPNLDPPKSITWTPGMDGLYREATGKELADALPLLFSPPGPDAPKEVGKARIDFYDLWTGRLRKAYFGSLHDWAAPLGVGSGGHLNGEDETINAVRYGFGQALRQLRAMDVPGVDLIWRQLFPGRKGQHFFPKYASSAAHQNGTRYSFTESFAVYGNGVTAEQMRWLINYQYVRGLNLLVGGCYPMSTRDHQMTGERPHFGRGNPCWDQFTGLNAYAARLGYAMSAGSPRVSTALYYPVRDMWALGLNAKDAVETHDRLAGELLARQRDFDLIDDDLLCDSATHIEGSELAAGAMRYKSIVCGQAFWMHPETLERLKQFAQAGGQVLVLGSPLGTDGAPGSDVPGIKVVSDASAIAELAPATASISPASQNIRVAARVVDDGEILAFFNEGDAPYDGTFQTELPAIYALDPLTGRIVAQNNKLHIESGEMKVLHVCATAEPDIKPAEIPTNDTLDMVPGMRAEPHMRVIVGEHDFEILTPAYGGEWWGAYKGTPLPFDETAAWSEWLTSDFSGQVDYRVSFDIPAEWGRGPLRLETGPIEYAATVLLDGAEVGYLLWTPWTIDLPPCSPGRHEIIIRAANTLANEVTSDRVTKLWAEKSGPGWPSPYHKRALEFEKESRGGGIKGPIVLRRMGG